MTGEWTYSLFSLTPHRMHQDQQQHNNPYPHNNHLPQQYEPTTTATNINTYAHAPCSSPNNIYPLFLTLPSAIHQRQHHAALYAPLSAIVAPTINTAGGGDFTLASPSPALFSLPSGVFPSVYTPFLGGGNPGSGGFFYPVGVQHESDGVTGGDDGVGQVSATVLYVHGVLEKIVAHFKLVISLNVSYDRHQNYKKPPCLYCIAELI